MLSAGVGVTPMVSALNTLVDARHAEPVLFLYAARNPNHQSLRLDIERARARLPRLTMLSFFEDFAGAAPQDARLGRMQVTPDLFAPFFDADFFLCGPLPFMRNQWRALRDLGIAPERIHREVFGPDLFDQLA
jgi:nitric oxide dioxygenase